MISQTKDAEKRTKRACVLGRTRGLGRFRENLPKAGDVKNDTAGLWAKSDLRVKRRDPWRRANALPKAAADPALNGQEAKENRRRVLTWFAGRWRNHRFSGLKSLTRNSAVARR